MCMISFIKLLPFIHRHKHLQNIPSAALFIHRGGANHDDAGHSKQPAQYCAGRYSRHIRGSEPAQGRTGGRISPPDLRTPAISSAANLLSARSLRKTAYLWRTAGNKF